MNTAEYENKYIYNYAVLPSERMSSGIDKVVKVMIAIFILVMPMVIVFAVPTDIKITAFLAYINCIIMVLVFRHFLLKGTLAAMVPILFLPYFAMGWIVSVLYLAIFYPNQAYYRVYEGSVEISLFDSGIKVQLVVMLFLLSYLSVVLFALRREGTYPEGVVANPRAFTFVTTIVSMAIILLNGASKVISTGAFITYIADAFYNYFWGLLFIPGAFIKKIPSMARMVLFAFLGLAMLFYTVGNARGMALFTVTMFIFGILFFSDCSKKTKLIIVVCLLFAFPMYLMISNTTRILTGQVGFRDFWYRFDLLKEWQSATAGQSAMASTIGRLFHSGGHSIIIRTPSEVPYHPLGLPGFANELAASLVPGYISYYTATGLLRYYGFNIELGVTSVEVSMIGGFWLLGGWPIVLLGGFGVGFFHLWLIKILQRATQISKMKAFIYFSVYAPSILWATNWQPINYWKITIYSVIFAFSLYQILRFTIGDPGRDMKITGNAETSETFFDENSEEL